MSELLAQANGSVFPNLSRATIESFAIPWPSDESRNRIVGLLASLHAENSARQKENHNLAQLRDVLLPKLMSGEIRIRDAEKVVGDAI
jgi:type I restriction enzyme S subunit